MTIINLVATDQVLTVAQKPVIASGDQNTVQLQVESDAHWIDYGLSAVFFTDADPTVYEAILTDGACMIPAEVLARECLLYIGIRGVLITDFISNTANVKTSTLVQYKIEKGAPAGTGTTVPPTADVYQQLLAKYQAASDAIAVERARLDNLVSLKGDPNAVRTATLSLSNVGGAAKGTVTSDGIHAVVQLSGMDISIEGNSAIQIATLPAEFAALSTVKQRLSMDSPVYYRVQGTALYVCCDNTVSEGVVYGAGANILYPLAAITMPEVQDARVAHDGTTYDSIGDAMRQQFIGAHSAMMGLDKRIMTVDTELRELIQNAGGNADCVKTVNGIKPDENGNVDTSQNGDGLSDTAKALLITILRNGVYSTDQSANITALENALAGGEEEPDEPVNPDKTLTSISAVYSGGDVTAGTVLADLTGIVVTAHYSDGTSATVTGYSLSGTIAEGSNTITVSYGGKTTTFAVTGVAESGGDVELNTDGLLGFFDFRNKAASGGGSGGFYEAATVGDGRLYAWHSKSAGNEYGAYINSMEFCSGASYTVHDFGTEFTWILKAYCDVEYTMPGAKAYVAPGNSGATVEPTYNTSDSTATATSTLIAKLPAGYHTVTIKASDFALRVYVDATLAAEYDGADIDGFVSWYGQFNSSDMWAGSSTYRVHTAMAFYDRALTDVEIVEMDEYLKTLEVA